MRRGRARPQPSLKADAVMGLFSSKKPGIKGAEVGEAANMLDNCSHVSQHAQVPAEHEAPEPDAEHGSWDYDDIPGAGEEHEDLLAVRASSPTRGESMEQDENSAGSELGAWGGMHGQQEQILCTDIPGGRRHSAPTRPQLEHSAAFQSTTECGGQVLTTSNHKHETWSAINTSKTPEQQFPPHQKEDNPGNREAVQYSDAEIQAMAEELLPKKKAAAHSPPSKINSHLREALADIHDSPSARASSTVQRLRKREEGCQKIPTPQVPKGSAVGLQAGRSLMPVAGLHAANQAALVTVSVHTPKRNANAQHVRQSNVVNLSDRIGSQAEKTLQGDHESSGQPIDGLQASPSSEDDSAEEEQHEFLHNLQHSLGSDLDESENSPEDARLSVLDNQVEEVLGKLHCTQDEVEEIGRKVEGLGQRVKNARGESDEIKNSGAAEQASDQHGVRLETGRFDRPQVTQKTGAVPEDRDLDCTQPALTERQTMAGSWATSGRIVSERILSERVISEQGLLGTPVCQETRSTRSTESDASEAQTESHHKRLLLQGRTEEEELDMLFSPSNATAHLLAHAECYTTKYETPHAARKEPGNFQSFSCTKSDATVEVIERIGMGGKVTLDQEHDEIEEEIHRLKAQKGRLEDGLTVPVYTNRQAGQSGTGSVSFDTKHRKWPMERMTLPLRAAEATPVVGGMVGSAMVLPSLLT